MTYVDELLAESVRLYPVLYNKADKFFKDVNKKTLAWEDVAKYACAYALVKTSVRTKKLANFLKFRHGVFQKSPKISYG